MSRIRFITAALLLVATPLAAQRRPKTTPPAPPPPAASSAPAKPGLSLDFQDQDIRVVLEALAEAGGINLTLSNLTPRKVTLRMAQPVDKVEFASMIRSIAEANDLKVAQAGSLLQVTGAPPVAAVTPLQLLAQQSQAAELRLYTYRLKHASATTIAPVLLSLFSGGTTNRTVITGPNGTTIVQGGGALNVPTATAGNGGGGRGGRGGGNNFGGNNGGGNNGFSNVTGPTGGTLIGNSAAVATQSLTQGGNLALSANIADVRIVGEESSNTLLVRASASDWALIQQVIGSIDQRPLQVLIEVTIAEVERTHDLDVGLSGGATRKSGSQNDSASFPTTASARDFILTLTGGKGTINYNVALNALQSRGDVRVLSLPVIIAQNNKQAVLNVGEQRPFVQVSQNLSTGTVPTTVQTIQYLDVGTVLTITPTINPDGYVNLAVDQTNNSATNEIEFDAPVISKREATTQVFLKDGQTTVIGGLSGNTSSKTVSGVPILSKIPIIGPILFGNTQKSTAVSELFLFLTPHIINDDDDIDKLKDAVKASSELLKEVPIEGRVPRIDTSHVARPDSLHRPAELPR
ncbi:MAG TPA: secretin N-terminal domain-containing protein [Gemmatimonadales bacterium]